MNKVNKLIDFLEGQINNFVINTYLKMKIPIFWEKSFKHNANNRVYVNNYYNRPPNSFDQSCPER